MRKLRLRRRARRDLAGIFAYTRQRWSLEQAERYLAAINAEFERLLDKPDIGRPVHGAQAPFFRRTAGSHMIFYLIADDAIDVVRVLHASMDFLAHLANDAT